MYNKIIDKIKEYNTIVIVRHIGVDPDALCSQLALRDSIKLTYPEKKVVAIGNGSVKFNKIGRLDKTEVYNNALLIVVDTPDIRRIDGPGLDHFDYKIKIDHHPIIDNYADLDLVEVNSTSTCEIIMDLIDNTELKCDDNIAELLYLGLISDSNRFLFNTCTYKTFERVSKLLKNYSFDLQKSYEKLYLRNMNEVRLEGYIGENLEVTDNGLGYIKVTNDIIEKFGVDTASAGNMINNFNYINNVIVWATLTEDKKNDQIRVSVRSRGPEINKILEKYNGGGHPFASGAKVKDFNEAMKIIDEIDLLLEIYNRGEDYYDN